jgi:hypothetical protein
MNKAKVTVFLDDIFCYRIKTKEETVEMFGEDYFWDCHVSIPEELLERYQKCMKEYEVIQDEIGSVYKGKEYNEKV